MADGRSQHESHIRRSRSMRRVLDITLIQRAVITTIGIGRITVLANPTISTRTCVRLKLPIEVSMPAISIPTSLPTHDSLTLATA
jgi:hypothetical protein